MTVRPAAHAPEAAAARPVREPLYTGPFLALCAIYLLGFAGNFLIAPVLPVFVVDRGGNAAVVGLVVAVFSLPSVVLRPVLGRLADTWSTRRVLAGGTALLAVANAAYLVPAIPVLFLVRVLHGTAWGAFNTGTNALLGHLAPAARRGEASGVFGLMPGVAQLLMPGLGLLLLGVAGPELPFALAATLSGAAVLVLGLTPALRAPARPSPPPAAGLLGGLLDRAALLPMALEFLFSSVNVLFLVYPPLVAARLGIPLEALALYYPAYGGVLVGVRVVAGRVLDRFPRRGVIGAGAVVAMAGLAVAAAATDLATLTAGGVLYAAAAGFTTPATTAMTIDRAHPGRLGAAMATYTLGFQLALGAGAAAWGVVIELFGLPAPYLGAMAVEAGLLVLLLAGRRATGRGAPGDGTATTGRSA